MGSSGVGVPDSYELLRVGAGNPELRSFGCLSVLVVGETPASWTSSASLAPTGALHSALPPTDPATTEISQP